MRRERLLAAAVGFGILFLFTLIGPSVSVLLVTLIGLGGCFIGAKYLHAYHKMWQRDSTDLRAVTGSDGEIEITGSTEAHTNTLQAPFTGAECVAYEIELIEPGANNARKREIREDQRESDADIYQRSEQVDDQTLVSSKQTTPFIIETPTGRALIKPVNAQLEITTTEEIAVASGAEPPQQIADFLGGHPQLAVVSDEQRVFREGRIDVGAQVHIYGPVQQAGASFDLPGGVKTVIGVERSLKGNFVLGQDSLADLLAYIRSTYQTRFVVSTGSEVTAERRLLKTGVLFGGIGLLFTGGGVFLII